MRKMSLLLVLFALPLISCIEEKIVPRYEWSYVAGGKEDDKFFAISQLADGNFIIAGETWSLGNKKAKSELWLVKLDMTGAANWQKLTGGPAFEKGVSITPLKDGGFILGGDTTSYGFGFHNIWLIRFDTNSNPVWQNIYKGQLSDTLDKVIPLSDGGFIVSATSESFGAGLQDYWLIRLDKNGITNWQKNFGGRQGDTVGGAAAARDGSIIIAGNARSFGTGIWIIKVNQDGSLRWEKFYSGKISENANAIIPTKDDGFIIAGYTWSFGTGRSDILVFKIDKRGELVWEETFGGKMNDVGVCIAPTADNGCVVGAVTESFGQGKSDIWILRLDANGKLVWQKMFGGKGYDSITGVCAASDGGFAFAGDTDSFGAGESDGWALKLNSEGNISNDTTIQLSNVKPANVMIQDTAVFENISEMLKSAPIPTIIQGDSFVIIISTTNTFTNTACPFVPMNLKVTQLP